MSDEMSFKVAPTPKAPVAGIVRVWPCSLTDVSKCESNINVGLFFDGTNNNMDADKGALRHTNIVRLYSTYMVNPAKGYFPIYIPGVGTKFPEIEEMTSSSLGTGFGIGCEARVLFGLLTLFNVIHKSAFNNVGFFNDAQVKALCCSPSKYVPNLSHEHRAALGSMGLNCGLLMPDVIGDGDRANILKGQAALLEKKLVDGRPRIKECFIDVFGFSRGAAEARVFCQWLDEILSDGKLAGIIIHLRFLGIMDTVASAGFVSSVASALIGVNGGHTGWAEPKYLRIPASVKNCVHMVAMHELRRNFPLDTATVDGVLPSNCQEFAYPGAHSDVGGGYLPNELGISVGKDLHASDALKLAQIPLNHMLECAVAAGAPLQKNLARLGDGYDPFAIAPAVQKAYDDFLTFSTLKQRCIHEWLQPYLNWRWNQRLIFNSLGHVRRANEQDRKVLIKFNQHLIDDAELMHRTASRNIFSMMGNIFIPGAMARANHDMVLMNCLDSEARSVLAAAEAAPAAASEALHYFFDGYVHDSLAGFDLNSSELTGYWRYRKGFLGSAKHTIASNDNNNETVQAMA